MKAPITTLACTTGRRRQALLPSGRWPWLLPGLALGWMLLCLPLAWWDMQGRWVEAQRMGQVWFKLWLFWAAWAVLPLLLHALQGRWPRRCAACRGIWLGLLLLAAWGSLIEPRLLRVHAHHITVPGPAAGQALPASPTSPAPLRVALVADIHLGLFVRQWQLQRLVRVINAQGVDAVLVAGDWVYEPPRDLVAALAPLRQLQAPVFAVLGNHDTGAPGMAALEQPLRTALQTHGVQLLEGRVVQWRGWQLAGLGDDWGGQPQQDWQRVRALWQPGVPRLLLAHQPDTVQRLGQEPVALAVSGHTHGGQVWLPWLTQQWVLPQTSRQGWYNGLYHTPAGALFVTAGAGQIGLPVRLAVPPRVDILTLTLQS